ncbi:Putative HTH-type transcriptional regulator [Anaerolineales bacterium]|nr:Putative HTH-type transcriptional regulator [Anaerolineales bacterium]
MIRINRQTDYAIRLILYIAQQKEGARVSTAEVRREMQIPPALAQRIVANLARGEFIQTFPGRDGGLVLARPAQEINLRQIVEHFEGKFFISDCLVDKGNCPFDNKCPVRFRWTRLQSQIVVELEQITFMELAQDAQSIHERLPAMSMSQTANS